MNDREVLNVIDEDELRAMLASEAERYDVPAEGAERARSRIGHRADAGPDAGPSTIPFLDGANAAPTRRQRMKVASAVVAAVLVVALVIGGLSGGRRSGSGGQGSTETSSGARRAGSGAAARKSLDGASTRSSTGSAGAERSAPDVAAGETGAPSAPSTPAPPTPPGAAPKIVKTGSLDIEVRHRGFSGAVARLTSLATGMGGFVAKTDTSEQGDAPTGTVTLRVPADRFEDLVVQARRLGKVLTATSGGQDVTAEYTDLVGRLRTLTNERDQLLLVLGEAKVIPDILAVRDRLNAVQTEIEQLQGRRKVLDDQTSLSTLTVSLREPGADRPLPGPQERSGLSAAWHRAVAGFIGGVEDIVAGSGKVALVVICGAVLWLLGRPLWHRMRRSLV